MLTSRASEAVVTISTLGVRGLQFDPASIAERLVGRFVGDLLRCTLFSRDFPATIQDVNVPLTAAEIVSQVMPSGGEGYAQPVIASGRAASHFPNDVPAIAGSDFKATVELGSIAASARLDRLPRRQWKEQIYERDFLLRRGRIAHRLEQLSGSFESLAQQESGRLVRDIAQVFAAPGGVSAANGRCPGIADRIEGQYTVRLREADTPSLSDSLNGLDEALRSIPHGPSLILRTLALVAFQSLVVLSAWHMPSSSIRSLVLVALAALSFLSVALAMFVRLRGARAAEEVRNRILGEIQKRCQLAFCDALQHEFDGLRARLKREVEEHGKTVAVAASALRSMVQEVRPVATPPLSLLMRSFPESLRDEELYAVVVGKDRATIATGDLADRFYGFLHATVSDAMCRQITPAVMAEKVVDFARAELLQRLKKLNLWHFFRAKLDEQASAPDREIAAAVLDPLVRAPRRVFLRGRLVEESLHNPKRCQHLFVAPAVLHPVSPLATDGLIQSGAENMLALVTSLELATSELADTLNRSESQKAKEAAL
jgi:hypothetical protein